ncbi:DUF885 domain-containing protein [Carbonactinospora thermoautotrophica]|uniref:DUF885 domain-containing protein n=1 Tax=Carbonactinospora thermoautotrophica TaxID=1469144 RepID=UPI000B297A48|nr:DUF885 domain-containing protein [Carbonactinospora thermoautotrophica]
MIDSPDARFAALAEAVLDDVLAHQPETATMLGDHRFDDRLSDRRPEALEERRRALSGWLRRLDELDPAELTTANRVDAQILRTKLSEALYHLEELREHEWNPLVANPGEAIYLLLVRDFAPLGDRLRSVAGRLAAVPEALAVARASLRDMPRVHVETAIGQFTGTARLIQAEIDRALAAEPALRGEIEAVRPAALEAIAEHQAWLKERLATATRDPRLGPERYARKLAYALDTESDPDGLLARAEADLARVSAEIVEAAARLSGERPDTPGLVRRVLDRLAEDRPDDDTIVDLCRAALAETTEFVRAAALVTVYDDPTEVIVMPEFLRGVAVAYCDPPGPLEPDPLPTFVAVSPTPDDWPPERVESFYREYNAHLVRNLIVHEAMPGHMLQLAHARRFDAPTRVRAAFWSGPFVEGWAVYAEELMARSGYGGEALRMQQLKMQLRTVINAILDIRVHAHGMTEAEALRLMTEQGFQEEGEAVGKWRRALLTSAQLPTYYVGYAELTDALRALAAARPGVTDRELHDELLAHGSPPPRHLGTLLGIAG